MVIRPDGAATIPGAAATWASLKRESLITLPASSPLQQVIDQQLARAGVARRPGLVLNSLETQIAMVGAGHGVAVVPTLGLPACRKRGIAVQRLTSPVVTVDYHVILPKGSGPTPAAEAFAAFLQRYIARWAGAAGILTTA
jgi:DNA-binding transcriptional LysR family regulator